MHRIIFMAGSLLASSLGLALAGLVLREAIRNARAHKVTRGSQRSSVARVDLPISWDFTLRGYDSPELEHEDRVARERFSGNTRNVE